MKDDLGARGGGELPAHLLMTAAVLFLAASVIFGRVYHAEVPPAGMAFWRALAALAVVLPFVGRGLLERLPLMRRHWKLLLALGATQTLFGQVPFFLGLHTTTAINAGLVIATQPVLILVLARVVLGDAVRPLQMLGLALSLAGVLAVIVRGDPAVLWRLDFVVGDLLVQLGVLSWAAYFILVKRAPQELDPLMLFAGDDARRRPRHGARLRRGDPDLGHPHRPRRRDRRDGAVPRGLRLGAGADLLQRRHSPAGTEPGGRLQLKLNFRV